MKTALVIAAILAAMQLFTGLSAVSGATTNIQSGINSQLAKIDRY